MNQQKLNASESLFWDYLQKGKNRGYQGKLTDIITYQYISRVHNLVGSSDYHCCQQGGGEMVSHTCTLVHKCSFMCSGTHLLLAQSGSQQAAVCYQAMDQWLKTMVYILYQSVYKATFQANYSRNEPLKFTQTKTKGSKYNSLKQMREIATKVAANVVA